MITGGEGGTVQKWLKKVFFEGLQKEIETQSIVLNFIKKHWIEMHPLCKYKWWSWGWDIIPDQNCIQGWRNGVFWTLPQPRVLPTLSRGKLKQSGIKYNKTFSSNEVLIMDIAVLLHQIVCVRPTSWLQLRQTHWKKKKASAAESLWPYYMCSMFLCLFALCLCV